MTVKLAVSWTLQYTVEVKMKYSMQKMWEFLDQVIVHCQVT
jgi:hypothetical protein